MIPTVYRRVSGVENNQYITRLPLPFEGARVNIKRVKQYHELSAVFRSGQFCWPSATTEIDPFETDEIESWSYEPGEYETNHPIPDELTDDCVPDFEIMIWHPISGWEVNSTESRDALSDGHTHWRLLPPDPESEPC